MDSSEHQDAGNIAGNNEKSRKEMLMEYLRKKKAGEAGEMRGSSTAAVAMPATTSTSERKNDARLSTSVGSSNLSGKPSYLRAEVMKKRSNKPEPIVTGNVAPNPAPSSKSNASLATTSKVETRCPNVFSKQPKSQGLSHSSVSTQKIAADASHSDSIINDITNKLSTLKVSKHEEPVRAISGKKLASVKDQQQLLVRIDEASCLSKFSIAGARAMFDDILSSDDTSFAKKKSIYWVARAKCEEDVNNYDEAIRLFDVALNNVDSSEHRVLETCRKEFIKRIEACKMSDLEALLESNPIRSPARPEQVELCLKNVLTPGSKSMMDQLHAFPDDETKLIPQDSMKVRNHVDIQPMSPASMHPIEKMNITNDSEDLRTPEKVGDLTADFSFSVVYDEEDPFAKYLVGKPNTESAKKVLDTTPRQKATPEIARRQSFSFSSINKTARNTPQRVPLVNSPDDTKPARIEQKKTTLNGASTVVLAEVRTPSKKIQQIGSPTLAVPVRRSIRNSSSKKSASNDEVLQRTKYSYAPNEALNMTDFARNLETESLSKLKKPAASQKDLSASLLTMVEKEFKKENTVNNVINHKALAAQSASTESKHLAGSVIDSGRASLATKHGVITPLRRSRRLTQTPTAIRDYLNRLEEESPQSPPLQGK